jgi:hypothetical protein
MPDTFTHIAIPSLFSGILKKYVIVPLFLIGTVCPDYLREFFGLLLPIDYYTMVYPFHSVIGAFFVSLFLTSFFVNQIRKLVFLSLFSGQITHLLFDMTQMYFNNGRIYLLFPYFKSITLNLIPSSYWFYIFLFSLTIFILIHLFRFLQKKKLLPIFKPEK